MREDAAGHVHQEGKIGSTRRELDCWIGVMPQPRMIAMEATIFSGWIYDHLLPHAEKVKVAHRLMRRAPPTTLPMPRLNYENEGHSLVGLENGDTKYFARVREAVAAAHR